MRKRSIVLAAALLLQSACGHGAMPGAPPSAPEINGTERRAFSIVHASGSRFWEYTLPSGVTPTSIANGPNGTVWFTGCNGTSSVYRLDASTGVVTPFKPAASYAAGCLISLVGNFFWYTLNNTSESLSDLVRVTAAGAFTVFDSDLAGGVSSITGGSDGRVWITMRNRTGSCARIAGAPGAIQSISISGVNGPGTRFPQAWVCPALVGCFCIGYYQPIEAVEAADNNFYVTSWYAGGTWGHSEGLAVIKISTLAAIINTFALPSGATTINPWSLTAGPLPIAPGPDGRLWIGEPGLNTVARMSTGGSFTSFKIPTANANPASITAVPGTIDSSVALWFAETSANKIARITTATGAFTEVAVPTPGAQPSGIIPCPTTVCGSHGGVWFVETAAHKVARYDFP